MPKHRPAPSSPASGVAVRGQMVQYHAGPLPDAETLARYDAVLPGLAERAVAMAEQEGQHRRSLEQREQRLYWRSQMVGVVAATVVAMTVTGASAFAIAMGAPAPGVAAIIAEIAALAGVFVWSRHHVDTSPAQRGNP